MELRQLRYFNQVAELGSVSKAAATLNMTQPSLSRQIMELEGELAIPTPPVPPKKCP
jgi:DNA-binding transcriptional LysR family regulator